MKRRNDSTDAATKRPTGAVRAFFGRLLPKWQLRHHVIFCLYLGAILTTWFYLLSLLGGHGEDSRGALVAAVLLWAAVVVACVVRARQQERAALELDPLYSDPGRTEGAARRKAVRGTLHRGDTVLVVTGEQVPADGIVVDGVAMVDESAITGESAPVLHESGSDCNTVKGGTTLLSGWLLIQLTSGVDKGLFARIGKWSSN